MSVGRHLAFDGDAIERGERATGRFQPLLRRAIAAVHAGLLLARRPQQGFGQSREGRDEGRVGVEVVVVELEAVQPSVCPWP